MQYHRLTLLWLLVMILLSAPLPGCATDRSRADEPTATRDQPASFPPIAGKRLLPLRSRQATVRVTPGQDQGQELSYQVERRDDYWLFTLEGRQRVYVRRNEMGQTLVFREDDLRENVSIHYEPALVLIPARLNPSTATLPAQEVDVIVRHLDSGNVRDRGTCESRMTRVWHEPGRTGNDRENNDRGDDDRSDDARDDDNTRERYGIVERRRIDLNLATATVELETVYVPDFGRIAWAVERSTRMLGLLSSSTSERYEVVDGAR